MQSSEIRLVLPPSVARILEREARRRRASAEQLILELVARWAIARECEERCEIMDGVVSEDCVKGCIEALEQSWLSELKPA